MTVLITLATAGVGAIAGAMLGGLPGFVIGGLLGYAVGRELSLRKRARELEEAQSRLREMQAWANEMRAWSRDAYARITRLAAADTESDPAETKSAAESQASASTADAASTDTASTYAASTYAASTYAASTADAASTDAASTDTASTDAAAPTPAPATLPPPHPATRARHATPTASTDTAAAPASDAPTSPTSPTSPNERVESPAYADRRAAHLGSHGLAGRCGAERVVHADRRAAPPSDAPEGPPAGTPHEPPLKPLARLVTVVKDWVTTGNAPVKVGVLVSLVGVGLLLREASRRGFITVTIEMRLVAAALFGLALLAIGWRQRRRNPVYGVSLQGGAVAVLHVTAYAAFAVYGVLPAAVAAAVVLALTAGAGVLAVTQDSRPLATLGIIGGFLAPVLAYSSPDDHAVVFGFYAVLSAAIVAVAWFKAWPELNLLGLTFTFSIAGFWLWRRFEPDSWPSVQPLIAVLVLLYLVIPLLFAVRQAPELRRPTTAILVFATPFMGLGAQYLAVGHTQHGMAVSAASLAAVEAALAVTARRLGPECRRLAEAGAALAVALAVLTVPLAFNAYFTAVLWAAQGGLLVWIGCRRAGRAAVVAGCGLQAAAAAALCHRLWQALPYPPDTAAVANEFFTGTALLAAAGLISGRAMHLARSPATATAPHKTEAPPPDQAEQPTPPPPNQAERPTQARAATGSAPSRVALAWAAGWWLAGGLLEVHHQVPASLRLSASLVFVVASLTAAPLAAPRLRWPCLDGLGALILPVLWFAALVSLLGQSHPLDLWGWAAWPLSVAALYWFLWAREGRFGRLATLQHAGGFWLLAVLCAAEVYWQTDRAASGVWAIVAPAAAWTGLAALALLGWRRLRWPLGAHRRVYASACSRPALLLAGAAVAAACLASAGDPSPLPFVPLLNPLILLAAAQLWLASSLGTQTHANQPRTAPESTPQTSADRAGVNHLDTPARTTPEPTPQTSADRAGVNHLDTPARTARKPAPAWWAALPAAAGVAVLTMELARTVHHWRGVRWDSAEMFSSDEFQVSLSILWAMIALTGMLASELRHRRARIAHTDPPEPNLHKPPAAGTATAPPRAHTDPPEPNPEKPGAGVGPAAPGGVAHTDPPEPSPEKPLSGPLRRRAWVAGATWAAVVVVKLFVVDLGGLDETARATSFIAVGVIFIVGGFAAPTAPARPHTTHAHTHTTHAHTHTTHAQIHTTHAQIHTTHAQPHTTHAQPHTTHAQPHTASAHTHTTPAHTHTAPAHTPTAPAHTHTASAQPSAVAGGSAHAAGGPPRRLARRIGRWITTRNAGVKVGVLLTVIGTGLLVSEAAGRDISETALHARLTAVAGAAAMLLAVGRRQRRARPSFGLSLQGGSLALLLVAAYASWAVHGMIPTGPAAAAVAVVAAGGAALAVSQSSRALAVLGLVGGMLAPLLTHTGGGDHALVLGFFVILSAAVVTVACFKTWPELNLLSLGLTFSVGAFWLWRRFEQADWPETQPLAAALVLLYVLIPAVLAARDARGARHAGDAQDTRDKPPTPEPPAQPEPEPGRGCISRMLRSPTPESPAQPEPEPAGRAQDTRDKPPTDHSALDDRLALDAQGVRRTQDAQPPEAAEVGGLWMQPLVYGTPFMAFGLQHLLVGHTRYGMAVSALALAAVHGGLAVVLRRMAGRGRNLGTVYAGLGTLFSAVAVPFALDANYITTVWAAQGGLLVWVGCRQGRRLATWAGAALQVMAATVHAASLERSLPYAADTALIANKHLLASVALAAAGMVSGWRLHLKSINTRRSPPAPPTAAPPSQTQHSQRHKPDRRSSAAWPALAWGTAWWLAGGLIEIGHQAPSHWLPASLAFLSASFGTAVAAAPRLRWPHLNALGLLIPPTLALGLLLSVTTQAHPLDRLGWAAWPLSIAVFYACLRQRERILDSPDEHPRAPVHQSPAVHPQPTAHDPHKPTAHDPHKPTTHDTPQPTTASSVGWQHVTGFWLLAVLVGVEAGWRSHRAADGVWPLAATLGAELMLTAAVLAGHRRLAWPLKAHRRVYLTACAGPMLVLLAVVAAGAAAVADGSPEPLVFLPVLNPLALLATAVLAAGFAWRGPAAAEDDHPLKALAGARWAWALAVAGTLLASAEAARTVHHWQGVAWDFGALAGSTTLQSALSVIWAVIGLSAMVAGVRLPRRSVWVAGWSFMAAVVAKLFLVDLSSLGAVSRVVSFLGVGVLLLIVGYLAPAPPATPNPNGQPEAAPNPHNRPHKQG